MSRYSETAGMDMTRSSSRLECAPPPPCLQVCQRTFANVRRLAALILLQAWQLFETSNPRHLVRVHSHSSLPERDTSFRRSSFGLSTATTPIIESANYCSSLRLKNRNCTANSLAFGNGIWWGRPCSLQEADAGISFWRCHQQGSFRSVHRKRRGPALRWRDKS